MRIFLAAVAGFAITWIVCAVLLAPSGLIPSPSPAVLTVAIGGMLSGFVARRNGLLAGFLTALLDTGVRVLVLALIFRGINEGKGIPIHLSTSIFWTLPEAAIIGVVAGWIGQKCYEMAARRRAKTPA